jgi:NADPH-dependent 2,4-dienoyl-CoA reductase/sulfur reductase-like enzyme
MFRRLVGVALVSAVLCSLFATRASAQGQPPVLVVGGTPAGVAAAVAAARQGAQVTLVARRDVLGGILTDAMMDQWDFNFAPDGAAWISVNSPR